MSKILRLLYKFKTAFWIESLLVVVGLMVLRSLSLAIDHTPEFYHFIFSNGLLIGDANYLKTLSAKEMGGLLQTIASSLITIATLVFSLSIVALLNIASNLSSRYVMNILNGKTIRVVMALFIGTYLYTILLSMSTLSENQVLVTSTFVNFLLFFICLASLVYYFKHIITSLQVDNICAFNTDSIKKQVKDILSPVNAHKISDSVKKKSLKGDYEEIYAHDSGYVNFIDFQKLYDMAIKHNLYIEVVCSTNQYVFRKAALAKAKSSSHIKKEILKEISQCFEVKSRRLDADSIDNQMMHLTDVAMKALSPGINDTNSAKTVADSLGSIFISSLEHKQADELYHDENGYLRLKIIPFCIEKLICESIQTLRLSANNNQVFLKYLLMMLCSMGLQARTKSQKEALMEEYKALDKVISTIEFNSADQKELDQAKKLCKKHLAN
jgi:uncharacterized membrane protein